MSVLVYSLITDGQNVVLSLVTIRLILIFSIVFMFVRLLLKKNPNSYKKSAELSKLPLPPGPTGLPIVGFLPYLDKDFHLTLTRLSKTFGPVYQIFLGRNRVVVLNDPRLIREAFRQPVFSGRPDTELTKILQGYGIVNSDGALWKEQRAFLHTVLRHLGAKSMMIGKNGLEHKIKTQVDDFLCDLKNCADEPFRIRPMIARAVSNVVGSLLMSMTFDKKDDRQFLRLLELIDEGFKLFTVAMPVNFVPLFRFIPGVNYAYKKIKSNRAETSEFFKNIADDHKSSLDKDNVRDVVDAYLIQQEKSSQESSEKTGSVGEPKQTYFSEAQLIQIMNDLFSAGLETVTSTLEWAVLFLMRNPDVQEKIYQEVMTIVGNERTPELDDLPHMPYTEATMYEVLRRSNVIALGNAHATLDDATIGGFYVPKDTHVLSNLYAIHMDPNLWEDPEKFDPTRFIKNGKVFKPDYFIPFSVGRRMCLGDVLTKMEVFLFLSTLVQKFEVKVPVKQEIPEVTGTIAVSIVPKPFLVSLFSRNKSSRSITENEE